MNTTIDPYQIAAIIALLVGIAIVVAVRSFAAPINTQPGQTGQAGNQPTPTNWTVIGWAVLGLAMIATAVSTVWYFPGAIRSVGEYLTSAKLKGFGFAPIEPFLWLTWGIGFAILANIGLALTARSYQLIAPTHVYAVMIWTWHKRLVRFFTYIPVGFGVAMTAYRFMPKDWLIAVRHSWVLLAFGGLIAVGGFILLGVFILGGVPRVLQMVSRSRFNLSGTWLENVVMVFVVGVCSLTLVAMAVYFFPHTWTVAVSELLQHNPIAKAFGGLLAVGFFAILGVLCLALCAKVWSVSGVTLGSGTTNGWEWMKWPVMAFVLGVYGVAIVATITHFFPLGLTERMLRTWSSFQHRLNGVCGMSFWEIITWLLAALLLVFIVVVFVALCRKVLGIRSVVPVAPAVIPQGAPAANTAAQPTCPNPQAAAAATTTPRCPTPSTFTRNRWWWAFLILVLLGVAVFTLTPHDTMTAIVAWWRSVHPFIAMWCATKLFFQEFSAAFHTGDFHIFWRHHGLGAVVAVVVAIAGIVLARKDSLVREVTNGIAIIVVPVLVIAGVILVVRAC